MSDLLLIKSLLDQGRAQHDLTNTCKRLSVNDVEMERGGMVARGISCHMEIDVCPSWLSFKKP